MAKRVYAPLVAAIVIVMLTAVGVSAQDYIPSPGVLSPDQVDFGGATVTIIGQVTADNFAEGTPKAGRLEEAMKLFNIGKIEFLYRPGAEVIMTRIMTGEATHDIIYDDWRGQYFTMARHGMLYPLDELLPQEYYDNLYRVDNIIHTQILALRGHRYTFGHIYGNCFRPTGLVYNQSMLEREGLPDIYELWKAGKWTWEEAEKLAKAVTRDTNGDGSIDQWGIANRRLDYGLYINNAQFVKKDPDGKYRYGWADEEAVWIFEKIAEWYRNGYVVPVELDADNRIKSGHVLMQFGADHPEGGVANNGDILVTAPLPTGPHTDRPIYPEWAVKYAAIPVTAEDPAALVALHDFLFRKDDLDFDTWLMSEVSARFPNQKSVEHLVYAIETWNGDVEWINAFSQTPDVKLSWHEIAPVLRGEVAARSYLESKAPVAQAEIDRMFNQ